MLGTIRPELKPKPRALRSIRLSPGRPSLRRALKTTAEWQAKKNGNFFCPTMKRPRSDAKSPLAPSSAAKRILCDHPPGPCTQRSVVGPIHPSTRSRASPTIFGWSRRADSQTMAVNHSPAVRLGVRRRRRTHLALHQLRGELSATVTGTPGCHSAWWRGPVPGRGSRVAAPAKVACSNLHASIINVLAPHFHAATGAPSRLLPRHL